MKAIYPELKKALGEARVLEAEPLYKYSTFRIGGTADLFFRAQDSQDLLNAIYLAAQFDTPFFVIGGGSNLLISDKGFRGLVIKNETKRIKFVGAKGGKEKPVGRKIRTGVHTVYIEVDSGVSLNRLVRYSLDQGLSGLQYFLGQPGTVGGAVYINAHNMKKGKFFGERLVGAKLIDKKGKQKEVAGEYFKFGYDYSILQKTREIVLSVVLELIVGDREELWQEATEVINYRNTTQPHGVFSSGCTFRNIQKSDAIRLSTPNLTVSAGYLIERAGLKGFSKGPLRFSDHHSNFIIHSGGAKASDVLELINTAKKRVKDAFGVELKEEIVLVGEF